MKKNLKEIDLKYDIEENTPGEYTVFYSNLPDTINSKFRLKEYITNLTREVVRKKISIAKIDPVFNLDELTLLKKRSK